MPVALSSLISAPSEGEMAQDIRSEITARPGLLARFQLIEDIRCAVKVRHTLKSILGVMVFGSAAVGGDSITEGMLPSAAFDGKSLRGARLPGGGQVRLLSLFDVASGTVWAQRQIGAKTTEVPELAPLLAGLDVAGMVLTGDALHTVRAGARHLTGDRRAHYVLILKDNQPTLLATAIEALTGTDQQFATRSHTMTDCGHGRTEMRTIRTALATGVDFPGAAQLFRILRYRGGLDGVRTSKEAMFGITSLPADLAGPEHLNHYARSHWAVEIPGITSAMSPSAKTSARSAPGNSRTSWPRSAAS